MLNRERLRSTLDALGRAADGCVGADMHSEELEDTLTFIETSVQKGPTLAHAF